MLSRLFIPAIWSPAGKGLTSWFSFAILNYVLSLYHVVSWGRCGTRLDRFLIFAAFLTLISKDVKFVFYLTVYPLVHSSHCLAQELYSKNLPVC